MAIPEAAAPRLHPRSEQEVGAVRERFGLPDSYLLWVGGLRAPDPRKRVAALARTPRTMPLVLVGPAGEWAHQLPDVILTGAITDDDELAAIYSGAHALVYPSKDEGFGLPAVEALACGTPVAACDVPALREVLGGQAMLAIGRGHGRTGRRSRVGAAPGSRAAVVDLGGRGRRDLAGLRRGSAEPDTWRSPHRRRAGGLTGSPRAA